MLIPTLTVRDIPEAIAFLTRVLDFQLAAATPDDAPFYAILTRGLDELHLTLPPGGRPRGVSSAIIVCESVDAIFHSLRARGLPIPTRADSPVHSAPVDQTWGAREFYVDDPSGNTLIYQQR
jgi:catechol 2,3-dioxygenase-like lactoylglutathione lyase family enzyme